MSKYLIGKDVSPEKAGDYLCASATFMGLLMALCVQNNVEEGAALLDRFPVPKSEDWYDGNKVARVLLEQCKLAIPMLEKRIAEEKSCPEVG